MESSFDMLEWESTSKEQDSLVYQLFGDIPTRSTCSAVVKSNWLTEHEASALMERKRKALKNELSAGNPKKKRKDKRQKNKFKQDQKLSAEQLAETTISKASDDVTATEEFEEPVLVHTISEKSNGNERKKAKKKKKADQTKDEDVSNKKEKKFKTDQKSNSHRDNQPETVCNDEIKAIKRTNQRASIIDSVNQFKVDVDPATPLNAEFDESDLMHDSIEGPSECKSKKEKKKKRKEKRKLDSNGNDLEFPNVEESTPETNSKQKRRKKSHESEHVSSLEEQIRKCSPELKETNSNILNTSPARSKSNLHEKMTKQLESSRFRWINEQLYTTTGDEAVELFSKEPNLFDIYHRGFTNQVKLWPVNPVDTIIEWLKKRPTSQVVADFGCGEAIIAQSVANKVHSFDLVAKNKFVTACNMAKVPLSSASIDVAVFCLSLMGTNIVDFLREAHRVLKPGGILKVAEVASRINDTAEFAKSLSRLGFKLQDEDTSNKMFMLFDFIKNKDSVKSFPSSKLEGLNLKPCIYKRR